MGTDVCEVYERHFGEVTAIEVIYVGGSPRGRWKELHQWCLGR